MEVSPKIKALADIAEDGGEAIAAVVSFALTDQYKIKLSPEAEAHVARIISIQVLPLILRYALKMAESKA